MRKHTFEDELADEMQKNLIAEEAAKNLMPNKVSEALDCLSKAAAIFDDIGLEKRAQIITKIMEKL